LLQESKIFEVITHGFDKAKSLNGIALSLLSSKWDQSEVKLDTVTLDDSTNIITTSSIVRHAARQQHLEDHMDCDGLRPIDRLLVLISIYGVNHKPASDYTRGKHVSGRDNNERLSHAQRPAGAGQFFAQFNDNAVSDATIQSWETEVLSALLTGSLVCVVKSHGSLQTYHIYCNLPHEIGYEGGTGHRTSRIRVEWSAGVVHSHPHSKFE
jgi:hypothetical protein